MTGHLALSRHTHASLYLAYSNKEVTLDVSQRKRLLWPVGAGLLGATFLTGLYFGIVSWAESPQHAAELFWEDRWIVLPIILGFGVQMALYVILKKRLFIPVAHAGPSGKLTGASGGHHVSGVLSFPTVADGVTLLEGASHLTLTIHNVDAPERSFTWSLTG